MGVLFVAASTQRIWKGTGAGVGSTIYTAVPFTVAIWMRSVSTGAERYAWLANQGASTSNYFAVGINAANAFIAQVNDGGQDEAAAGTVVANRWFFVVARFISATNRRISVLSEIGAISHAQNTTSLTPTGVDTEQISGDNGFGSWWNGHIAEFWSVPADIQPGGAQLDNGLLFQLAYQGPFSVSTIGPQVFEYIDFQNSVYPGTQDTYWGSRGAQQWAQVNTPKNGLHPSLPYSYVKPSQTQKLLVI